MEKWLDFFARANFRRSADTAHDLKTPLNVAVLNLELLRMRLAKITGVSNDEKITAYTAAIENELRRLARIFDTFFVLSTPPKDDETRAELDIAAIAREMAATSGYRLNVGGRAMVWAHESRMRQAMKLFFEGASRNLPEAERTAAVEIDGERFSVSISARAELEDFDLSKVFKFYYSDVTGQPDLSLASARLIAETYGGELSELQERDKVILRLSFPLGDP
jgi:nitrogen fixation/metabolism regulation signal transduction histidine kinase